MEPRRLSYAYLTQTIFTKYGSFSRDLRDGVDELRLRLRPDLAAIELKRDRWEGDSVFVPIHWFQSYVLLPPEPKAPTKK